MTEEQQDDSELLAECKCSHLRRDHAYQGDGKYAQCTMQVWFLGNCDCIDFRPKPKEDHQ